MTTLQTLLDVSLWTRELTPEQRRRVEGEIILRHYEPGGQIGHKGDPVEYWMGVIDGLVKISSVSPDGKSVTFAGAATGSWFGEGSVLSTRPRMYDIVALRKTKLALMPRTTFNRLLDESIPFNRFLLLQLNERLSQFIAMMEYNRLLDVDARLARCIAAMFNPVLYPGSGPHLKISQEELGYLSGASRQRINQALKKLEDAGLIEVEYGGIRILDLQGLGQFGAI